MNGISLTDSDLYGIRVRVNQRRALRTVQFNKRVTESLAGLGCACKISTVSGYRSQRLSRAVSDSLSGVGTAMDVPALVPISDKSALRNAIRYFQSVAHPLQGLGTSTEQTSAAASGAAAGAKVGSIVPGIGTVIGAAVGAIVGWISGKPKPVRATAEQIAQCRSLLSEYMQFASQTPNAPIPLDKQKLIDLNWCLDALHGARVGLKDPRWFSPDVEGVFIPLAKATVRKIYETPVGATVNIDAISFKDPKGRTISFKGFSFTNPVFTDLKSFNVQFFAPMMVQMCKETAGKGAGGCEGYYGGQVPEFTRWLYDLLAWAAREELPNISEADLRSASHVATEVGSSASDVVKAVEQILNRDVQRNETAALLPVPTGPPSASTPGTPVVNVVTPSVAIPDVSAQSAKELSTLISQLVAQGQSQTDVTRAALIALQSRGATVTPEIQSAVQKEIEAKSGGNPWLIGGAAMAFFLLAMPARKSR